MKISIASDHAGFEMKQLMINYLVSKGHDVMDCGPDSADRCDYPDYAASGCAPVVSGTVDRGVLVCGTGIGMAIAANKVHGIRAANCINTNFAQLCREHNDANVITLSARFVSEAENQAILDAFLTTDVGGGRHAGRVEKIMALEKEAEAERLAHREFD